MKLKKQKDIQERPSQASRRATHWAIVAREQLAGVSDFSWDAIRALGRVMAIQRDKGGYMLLPEMEPGFSAFYEAEPGRAYLFQQKW